MLYYDLLPYGALRVIMLYYIVLYGIRFFCFCSTAIRSVLFYSSLLFPFYSMLVYFVLFYSVLFYYISSSHIMFDDVIL